ncbi:bcl-2-related ovarian killer protein isoform X3 [Drosophila santomea]|uniref:bcl-2-related ovarian killer protein isoform X3 n=1 Tax=Drosophila santomea TaxID=129105 RepID=UPI0019537296|nr:bcl-2-related ovarian killer protein isoform X3 [Drosophila santomea]
MCFQRSKWQVLGDELERMHPRVYTGVARQICRNPGGEFHTPDAVSLLLGAVGRELFRVEITWSKVISLFAIAGGLSVDCVRQGHPEYLPKLMESVSEVIEDELVPWINENGGWSGINTHVLPTTNSLNPLEWTTLVIGVVFGLILVLMILRFIFNAIVPKIYQRFTN